MKISYLIIAIIIITSCNRKVYYEYYNSNNGSYYFLETNTKKDKVTLGITRANSFLNYVQLNGISEQQSNNFISIDKIDYICYIDLYLNYDICTDDFKDRDDYKITYFKKYKDTLSMIEKDFYNALKQENCITDIGLYFLPKYFVKTDQINHDKLPKSTREAIMYMNNEKFDFDVFDRKLLDNKKREFPQKYKLFDAETTKVYYNYFDKTTESYFVLTLKDKSWMDFKILRKDGSIILMSGTFFNTDKENVYEILPSSCLEINPDFNFNECNLKKIKYEFLVSKDDRLATLNISNLTKELYFNDSPVKSSINMVKAKGIDYNKFPRKIRKIIYKNDTEEFVFPDIEEALKKLRK